MHSAKNLSASMDIVQYNLNNTELNYIGKLEHTLSMSCSNIREHTQDFGGMVVESTRGNLSQVKIEYFINEKLRDRSKTGKMSQ